MLTMLLFFAGQFFSATEELPPKSTIAGDASNNESLAVVIRIPQTLIAKSVNQDFNHQAPVQRIVLGTDSRGTAHCHGQVICTIEDNPNGASFCCTITGTVQCATRGTNGPAVIASSAASNYVAKKRFTFDGHQFTAVPATVEANTKVAITGVGSTLPGLRGRIVRRVASQKADQSLAQVEAITRQLTEQDLRQKIDDDLDGRIAEMNRTLAEQLTPVKYFEMSGGKVHVRSRSDGVVIGLLSRNGRSEDLAEIDQPIGEAIELWLRTGADEHPRAISAATLLSRSPQWLAKYFSNDPKFSMLEDKTVDAQDHNHWLVLRLH